MGFGFGVDNNDVGARSDGWVLLSVVVLIKAIGGGGGGERDVT